MCLFPKILPNPKYKATKKNKVVIPERKDERVKWVPVGCSKCMECLMQRARAWQVRLQAEIRTDKTGQFVTLTLSSESLAELGKEIQTTGYQRDNDIITLATRRFLERWRRKYKKSVKQWLVSEL